MRENKPLLLLFLINSIFVFAGSLFGPLYALYVSRLDNSITAISFSWSVFMLSSTLFSYLIGKYGDKLKEQEYLLAAGFFVRGLAWVGYIFVDNLVWLIVLQVFLGLGEAMGTPSWNAIFAKHLDNKKEVMEYSSWNVINNLMVATATVVGGFIASYFGFNALFVIMSSLAFVSFFGVIATPRKTL